MRQVLFRVDASAIIGSGHVMRCVTLAKELRDHGYRSVFICREHIGHLCDFIQAQGFEVIRLPPISSRRKRSASSAYESWLGGDWEDDAAECILAIEGLQIAPDVLVVDHYAVDRGWEQAIQRAVSNIVAIDDLADRAHSVSLLIDQNLVANMQLRYEGKVPADCELLLGPGFALLQAGYAQLHADARPRKGRIKRILLYFGASDEHNLTGLSLDAIGRIDEAIHVDVVLGHESQHSSAIQKRAAGSDCISLHCDVPSLGPLMAAADISIGASGAANWERLCVGLPALVISVAANQVPIAEEMERRGLARYLGCHDLLTAVDIEAALRSVITSGLDEDWSLRCLAVVDGLGSGRVVAKLMSLRSPFLRARRVGVQDEELLLTWSNDAKTRQNAFNSDPIAADTHARWLRDRLRDGDNCVFYIVVDSKGESVGTVRFQCIGPEWEVHFAVAPYFRGMGLGRPMLTESLRRLRRDVGKPVSVVGRVKLANQASQRIFERLGFVDEPEPGGETILYRLRA